MATETQNLRLDQIRIDGGTQPRVAIDEDVVADYADLYRSGMDLPPVTVFHDGATHWLADGFHRYWANKRINCKHIFADVRQGTQRDAVLYSVGANASHGLRRTNADKRKAVLTMLEDKEWSQWSDREIAKRCGVSDKTVGAARKNHTAEIPQYDQGRRTFTHPKTGKPTTMNTPNIGRRSPAKPSPPRQIMTKEEYEAGGEADANAGAPPAGAKQPSIAIQRGYEAIAVLKSINPADPRRREAMHMVRDWIIDNFG